MEIRKPIISTQDLRPLAIDKNSSQIDVDNACCSDVNLENRDFVEVSFDQVYLENASFQLSKIGDLRMIDSILNKVNLTGAQSDYTLLERVGIESSRLQGTQLREAKLKDLVIKNSKCAGLFLRFAKIERLAFINCDLQESDFQGSELKSVVFSKCNLKNSRFSQTRLTDVDLRESDIDNIALSKDSIHRLVVSTGQAIYLSSIFGLEIEDK